MIELIYRPLGPVASNADHTFAWEFGIALPNGFDLNSSVTLVTKGSFRSIVVTQQAAKMKTEGDYHIELLDALAVLDSYKQYDEQLIEQAFVSANYRLT